MGRPIASLRDMAAGSTEELVAQSRDQLEGGETTLALAGMAAAYEAAARESRWAAAAWAANWIGHVHEQRAIDRQRAARAGP